MTNYSIIEETKTAKIIYTILHPAVLFVITPLIITLSATGSILEMLKWAVILAGVFMLPVYLVYKAASKSGNAEVPTIVAGAVLMGVCLGIAVVFDAPHALVVCLAAAMVGILVSFLVHKFVAELSLHVLMLAGAATAAVYSSLIAGLIMLPLALLSTWAVIRLKKATLAEALLSWGVMSVCVLVIFVLFL